MKIVTADVFSQPDTTYSSPLFVFAPPEPVSRLSLLQIPDFAYFNNSGFAVRAGS